jgi:hypothetical protein
MQDDSHPPTEPPTIDPDRFQPGAEPDAEQRAGLSAEMRRRQIPQAKVAPQFSDYPGAGPRRWIDGYITSGCLIPALILGTVVLALVVLALFLPPVSLWDEIDQQLNSGETGANAGPDTFSLEGLTFTVLNDNFRELTVFGLTLSVAPANLVDSYALHVEALTPADYLTGNIPAAGWHCPPDLPAGHALASRVYSLTQSRTKPRKVSLELTALPENAGPGELALHIWNATREEWVFIPGTPAENPLALHTELVDTPRCVALFRQAASARFAGVALDVSDNFAPEMMAANMRLFTGSIHPTPSGALNVLLAPGFGTGQGYDVIPLVQNFDDPAVIDIATVERILSSPALRTEHARQIAAFVLAQDSYAGAAIDYRAIPTAQHDAYTVFLRELADLLHADERTLTVILPPPTADGTNWQTGAYDWVAIGQIADRVVVTAPLNPRAYVADGIVDSLLTWCTTQIARSKLLLGLNAFSIADFGNLTFAPVTLAEALAYLGDVQFDSGTDVPPGEAVTARLVHPAQIQAEFGTLDTEHYLRYTDAEGQALRTIWLTDVSALNARLDRIVAHDVGGVFIWHSMSSGVMPGLAESIIAYRLDQAAPTPGDYDPVQWAVYAAGARIAEGSGKIDEPFTFQPVAEGTIRVEARFASGDLISSAELKVSVETTPTPTQPAPTNEPTATPTLEPTPEPTSEPTAEPTLEPTTEPTAEPTTSDFDVQPLPTIPGEASPTDTVAPTPTVADTATPDTPTATLAPPPTMTPAVLDATPVAVEPTTAPADVTAPSETPPPDVTPLDLSAPMPVVDPALLADAQIGTAFEAGTQIGGVSSTILQAGRMGLNWVKIDVHYRLGQSPTFFERGIGEAQANGFKVLLNVTGDPFEFMATDRALYLGGYVQFVGDLAAMGVEGIEVWHGMNGRMMPDEYVQMLGYAYHAIKTANPNTFVITGALRPVASTENLDEDDGTYYIRLGEAGVASYADCIGVEYTIGTVSPTSTSGDPRGDSPVYYLPSVTDRAGRAAQRADDSPLPLCFTRLGYLAPEGYPPLPEDYAWAQAITLDQQAEWLAEAIQLSQQGTQVRLLIVWALDASYFGGGSPEEGYAIIRPDGSCPACGTIAPLFEDEEE